MRLTGRIVMFLLVLETAMAIHEYGHLREFQKYGIPVGEVSVGIGWKLYTFQKEPYEVNLRAIPVMAYVAPTEEGSRREMELPTGARLAINLAGVENNFLTCLLLAISLQCLGLWKRRISFAEFLGELLATPMKMLFQFLLLFLRVVTFGRIIPSGKLALSTGGIVAPKYVRRIMRVSLVLAIMNIAPVPYLDGGHAITAILDAWRLAMPPLPDYVSPFVFFVYISSFRSVDIELFEMDWETGDI